MAYLPYEEDEEALGMGGPNQGGAPGVSATQTYNPSGPSRFTNFASYFNANGGQAAGDKLVADIEAPAKAAKAGAETTKADVSRKAKENTIQGPTGPAVPNPTVVPPPAAVAPPHAGVTKYKTIRQGLTSSGPTTNTALNTARTQAARTYGGPSVSGVDELFAPLQKQATNAARGVSLAQDAAGVKALRGGTGFEATLARAGAGGRMAELRKRYGNLVGDVSDVHMGARGDAEAAANASGVATQAWGQHVRELEAEEARQAEAAAAAAREVDAARARDAATTARNQTDPGRLGTGRTNTQTEERYAMLHGLTLDEYIRAGRPNLDKATPEDIERIKRGG